MANQAVFNLNKTYNLGSYEPVKESDSLPVKVAKKLMEVPLIVRRKQPDGSWKTVPVGHDYKEMDSKTITFVEPIDDFVAIASVTCEE